LKIKIKTN